MSKLQLTNERGVHRLSRGHGAGLVALAAALGMSGAATAQVDHRALRFTIQRVGMSGEEYSHPLYGPFSHVFLTNSRGDMTGRSIRYDPVTHAEIYYQEWVCPAGGGEARALGLEGPQYVRSDGWRETYVRSIDDAGMIVGYTRRYSGMEDRGFDAWVTSLDGGPARQVGFVGPGYERSDGYRQSEALAVRSDGQILGYSLRYGNNTSASGDSWVVSADLTSIERIGLIGPGYDPPRTCIVSRLLGTGAAAGYSRVDHGVQNNSFLVWLTAPDLTSPILLGLQGSPYVGISGYQHHELVATAPTGYMGGHTNLITGFSGRVGCDAWASSPDGEVVRVGLNTPPFVGSNGLPNVTVRRVNSAGIVAGLSDVSRPETILPGKAAWVTDANFNSRRVGLTGPGYTVGELGYSSVWWLDDNGYTAGASSRIAGGSGSDVWCATPDAVTTRITPQGPQFVRSTDGYRFANVIAMNSRAQVLGNVHRFEGPTTVGYQMWMYDAETATTTVAEIPFDPDGHLRVDPEIMTETGVALGDHSPMSDYTDEQAFWWDLTTGFHNLESLVVGGIEDAGWSRLIRVGHVAGDVRGGVPKYIVGKGARTGFDDYAGSTYLLTRIDPCSADFNGDGFRDPDDLADFITCFFLDVQFPGFCPAADFNGDTSRDPDDLADFITTFFLAVGC